ncbi:MAG: hypothetical protein HC844_04340 [Tabrizicola sp.]|nr:hypothetical protein [Tabrizicola sp.]
MFVMYIVAGILTSTVAGIAAVALGHSLMIGAVTYAVVGMATVCLLASITWAMHHAKKPAHKSAMIPATLKLRGH